MSSMRIQDNLLQHVKTNGFKEGFIKISQKQSEETRKSEVMEKVNKNESKNESQLTINFELKKNSQ
jgi:hypothetical protein